MGKTNFNFTQRSIDSLPVPTAKRVAYHDTQVPALGLLVQPTGHKSFFWFCKVRAKPTWRTIGSTEKITIGQARDKAQAYNGLLAEWKLNAYRGDDPFSRTPARDELTLTELVEDYVSRHVLARAKRPEKAARNVRWMVERYLGDWLTKPLREIRRKDVVALHDRLGDERGHHTANRAVQLLRTIFNFSNEIEKYAGENPAARITPFYEAKRERFLAPDELARLFAALKDEPNADLRDFVNLSLWTGARKSDVLSMRWENVSLGDNRWDVPDPKNRTPYAVPLTPEAVEILERRSRLQPDAPWVFPGIGKSGHIGDLKKRWKELLRRARITGVRQHDLRRTQGSWQAAQGVALLTIGKSLGHKSIAATQVYARLDLDPVRAAMTAANAAMSEAMRKKPRELEG